jgi:adenosylcobinamide-GDP ribazoletransferase
VRRELALLLTAVTFLTRLPAPLAADFRTDCLSQSARYFPLVGVLVGCVNVTVWWVASQALPSAVAVGLMLSASLLFTGAFHEDGFADTCDGFGGGTTVERVLEIMKDSRIGAYGALGLVMMVGLKWSALTALPALSLPFMVISAHMFSRWCAIGLIWALAYVRVAGESKSKPFADTLSGTAWCSAGIVGLMGLVPVGLLCAERHDVLDPVALIVACIAAAITALAAGAYFRRRIGGYTGDCLGAVQQLSELAFLLAGLAVLDAAPRAAVA